MTGPRLRSALRAPRIGLALALASLSWAQAWAAPPASPTAKPTAEREADGDSEAEFKARYANLVEKQAKPVQVLAKAEPPPPAHAPASTGGAILAADARSGIYTPPLLTTEDMRSVVEDHMAAIRRCYKAQLSADPAWTGELILDVAVKRSGRVSEVSVAPRRTARSALGRCLISEVPKWKFPEFTGEVEEGVTQEVINASLPFAFAIGGR